MAPSPRETSRTLQEEMEKVVASVNRMMDRLVPAADLPEAQLFEAMRYSTLGGGKRLRPFLVIHSAHLFGVDFRRACRVAAALEMLHSYSLVHDDLPAMDNADLRRGQPSTHKKFDEATAILAGDGLLTYAFEVLADPETHDDPRVRVELVAKLAHAAGPYGMVGGQMLDLIGEKQTFDLGTISRLQRLKTGKLIAFACEAGAILGRAGEPQRRALANYATDLGLAFQVTDDILDVEGNSQETGKPVGADAAAGKATFVSTMGKEQARAHAEMLVRQAIAHLHMFDSRAESLKELAQYVLQRRA
jgi:farnesyl diphosphate synthase